MPELPPEMPPQPESPKGGDGAGQEVIDAIKVLMLFAKSQEEQGNPGLTEHLKAFVGALSGEGAAPEGGGPMPPQKAMPPVDMNANKGAVPVM